MLVIVVRLTFQLPNALFLVVYLLNSFDFNIFVAANEKKIKIKNVQKAGLSNICVFSKLGTF